MFEYIKQFNRPKYLFLSFYIIGLLVFTSSRTNCQSPDNYFYQRYFNKSWTANAHIALGGDYFASPSSVIKYSKYFLPIQFADNENLKDKISSNLINENYFGSGVDAYLSLTPGIDNLLKIKDLGVNFQIKSINHQKMLLTDDFFNILLEGNSMFAGKTAVMKPFDYNSYSYQEFQINFISSKITSKYKNLNYNIGISLLKGSTFAKIETDRATFFTSEEGDSIYADFKVDVMTSDRDQNDIYYVNGLGSSINGHLFLELNNNNSIFLSLDNIGFISWNKNSGSFSIDTNFSYTGYDILNDNPFKGGGYEFFLDTFDDIKDSMNRKEYLFYLPPRLTLVYFIYDTAKGIEITSGLIYERLPGSMPHVFANIRKYLSNDRFYIQTGMSFDEYRNAGVNLELGINIKKKYIFVLGTSHLEGTIFRTNGQNLYFSIFRNFSVKKDKGNK